MIGGIYLRACNEYSLILSLEPEWALDATTLAASPMLTVVWLVSIRDSLTNHRVMSTSGRYCFRTPRGYQVRYIFQIFLTILKEVRAWDELELLVVGPNHFIYFFGLRWENSDIP